MTYYVKFNYIKKRCVKLYYIKKTQKIEKYYVL